MFSVVIRLLLVLLLWAPSAWAACSAVATYEVCGNGIDDDCSGTFGSCGAGEVNTWFNSDGCDRLCPSSGGDQDGDGYGASGFTGIQTGTDCDDTNGDIYPGRATTSGCSGGQYRVCQTNGTYSACSASDYCPSGCTSCRYIDAVGGSNLNNGQSTAAAWADFRMFTSYYAAPDQPAGYEAPTTGRCYLFKSGTYTYNYAYNTGISGLMLSGVVASAANPIKIMAYPGATPIFNVGGTSGTPIAAINIRNGSQYIDVEGISFTGNFCDGSGYQQNGFCFSIDDSDDIRVRSIRMYSNQGNTPDNFAAIGISPSSDNVTIDNSYFRDNYYPAGSGQDAQIMTFRGVGTKIRNNTIALTVAAQGEAESIRQKHADYASTMQIKGNSIIGDIYGVSLSGGNYDISNNFIGECTLHAFYMADRGGTSYQVGTMSIKRNTIRNCLGFASNPQLGYNVDGSTAADACSGDPTPGTMTFEENVFQDNSASYPGESEVHTLHVYGPDSLCNAFVASGKTVFRNNCYYNTGAVALAFNVFGSNNADATCSGRGSAAAGTSVATSCGNSFASFASWTGVGFDTGSLSTNPNLTADQIATGSCANWGWNIGRTTAASSTPATTSIIPVIFNRDIRRKTGRR